MKRAFLIILGVLLFLQLFRIEKTNPSVDKKLEFQAPSDIKTILQKACYDCHSNNTKWPWYSNIAPFSWSVKRNVTNGRSALNFSIWEAYDEAKKLDRLKEIYRSIYVAMPPTSYIRLHPEADLSKDERTKIREWIGR